jgi:thiamine-phosphate diphosphorylase
MRELHLPGGLYAIVDSLERAGAAVEGGAAVVQLRMKRAGAMEILSTARAVAALCKGRAAFIMNDRSDIARLSGADGVHLGQDDLPVKAAREIIGPGKLVGVSTHSDAEIDAALAAGADYLGFGPVFATASKDAALPPPHGLAGLVRAVARAGGVPVVAIGGITSETVREVAATGARCAAAIAELARDPLAARRFAEAFR